MSREKNLKNDKVMNASRLYWKQPRLASQLSKEQRTKVTEKFLGLVKKSREEKAKQMSKTMKEKNRLLPPATKETREK